LSFDRILGEVGAYYGAKVVAHGATPNGVDWNSEQSQSLRFEKLVSICDLAAPFSLNDYGCGYGALLGFLNAHKAPVSYSGYDIAPEMISKAKDLFPGVPFTTDAATLAVADYTVASGIFNVKLGTGLDEWRAYVSDTIQKLAEISRRGFAFNMLTSYSDADRMRPDLFYADPCYFFDLMKRRHSRWVDLLHGYGLYEFTILVRTDSR
jgi:hypothetical protein